MAQRHNALTDRTQHQTLCTEHTKALNCRRATCGRVFKTVLSSGYILILLSIENILASLIETCQGWSRMRNVK